MRGVPVVEEAELGLDGDIVEEGLLLSEEEPHAEGQADDPHQEPGEPEAEGKGEVGAPPALLREIFEEEPSPVDEEAAASEEELT